MNIDPYILCFSAITVIATIWMGFRSAKTSKTASDFFVAGRSVSVGWNASAISGEYLSAASFMGVAGMVMSSGYDALWYPVCYACGYLFLLLFIAGPLRRFGAYTIPDFAEGRYDSPLFRKIAVVFVLFIGFFYTMPQMKGAGTTLAYIFPGLPYWVGVALVGAVITLNVALGGMKGITLVQAFQYWIKMFAISVPIFVLMAVYGHYGKQLKVNAVAENHVGAGLSLMSIRDLVAVQEPTPVQRFKKMAESLWSRINGSPGRSRTDVLMCSPGVALFCYGSLSRQTILVDTSFTNATSFLRGNSITISEAASTNDAHLVMLIEANLKTNGIALVHGRNEIVAVPVARFAGINALYAQSGREGLMAPTSPPQGVSKLTSPLRKVLPEKAPADSTWLPPFGPLTTKAAKAAAAAVGKQAEKISREGGEGSEVRDGRSVSPPTSPPSLTSPTSRENPTPIQAGAAAEKAWLAKHEKPFALLYTYSLIIALVCGTAGLPHILVRFYTNPDGVAAKRTTMWVMILIGVFYVFPPVFGVMGRNLMPSLYEGTGAKGTDKVVLELPRILNQTAAGGAREGGEVSEGRDGKPKVALPSPPSPTSLPSLPSRETGLPWGSILSGITCAGAFAAFMSTFSGLLVSMTGAMAHDVYGRMLRPDATPAQRMRAFKIAAVLIGGVAVLLGTQVEQLQINFMVGQAFAIAAASYFPLLFMSVWWRGMTMKGAAVGMLTGGTCALSAVTLTNFSDLKWIDLTGFWAAHPLARILCEQPAIWTVPLAIGLMVAVSKLTKSDVPPDIRMKMLVLHAPEQLGLKQEYIQEHQHGH
jgi:Na+(H+)/acetate symporter ActP